MSIYQAGIVLVIVFVICLVLSFKREKSKKRTVARIISTVIFMAIAFVVYLFKGEFSELDKCNQNYQGFYVNGALCYDSANVSHDYLEGNSIKIAAVMNLTEKAAVVKATDGRMLIVIKSPNGFSILPYSQ